MGADILIPAESIRRRRFCELQRSRRRFLFWRSQSPAANKSNEYKLGGLRGSCACRREQKIIREFFSGKKTRKVVPLPGSLSTSILPLCASTTKSNRAWNVRKSARAMPEADNFKALVIVIHPINDPVGTENNFAQFRPPEFRHDAPAFWKIGRAHV